MECRLRQNYSRLPTQTTWMITLMIPRPKLGGSAPPQTPQLKMSDILHVYPTSDIILDVGYSISEGVIMEQPTQNDFDSFGTQ